MEPEPIDCITEFKHLVKNTISPAFKKAGFDKSDLNFYRRTNDIIQTFWVDRDKHYASNYLHFRFEVGLLSEEIYNEFFKVEMPEIPQVVFSTLRINPHAISEHCKRNHILSVYRDETVPKISMQIEREIRDYFIPFFEKYNSTNTWGELLDLKGNKVTIVPGIRRFRVYLKIGRAEQAAIELNKTYDFYLQEYKKTLEYKKQRLKGKRLENDKALKISRDSLVRVENFAAKYNIVLKSKAVGN
jgi:hypothetical protein